MIYEMELLIIYPIHLHLLQSYLKRQPIILASEFATLALIVQMGKVR